MNRRATYWLTSTVRSIGSPRARVVDECGYAQNSSLTELNCSHFSWTSFSRHRLLSADVTQDEILSICGIMRFQEVISTLGELTGRAGPAGLAGNSGNPKQTTKKTHHDGDFKVPSKVSRLLRSPS